MRGRGFAYNSRGLPTARSQAAPRHPARQHSRRIWLRPSNPSREQSSLLAPRLFNLFTNARERIRTSMPLRASPPQGGVSAVPPPAHYCFLPSLLAQGCRNSAEETRRISIHISQAKSNCRRCGKAILGASAGPTLVGPKEDPCIAGHIAGRHLERPYIPRACSEAGFRRPCATIFLPTIILIAFGTMSTCRGVFTIPCQPTCTLIGFADLMRQETARNLVGSAGFLNIPP